MNLRFFTAEFYKVLCVCVKKKQLKQLSVLSVAVDLEKHAILTCTLLDTVQNFSNILKLQKTENNHNK